MKTFINIIALAVCMSLMFSGNAAAETFNIKLGEQKQTVEGTRTIQNDKEYIIVGTTIYSVLSRTEPLAGDLNGDGQLTVADMTELVNIILGRRPQEKAVVYNVEEAGTLVGIVGGKYVIDWGGTSDGTLEPNVKVYHNY